MCIMMQVALKQFWVEAERPPPSSLQAYFHDSQVPPPCTLNISKIRGVPRP